MRMKATPCLAVVLVWALSLVTALLAANQAGAVKRWISPEGTRLISACQTGDEKSVRELLKLGLDVEERDQSGSTPLHIAAFNSHAKIAALLLRNGAYVEARNKAGETPLRLAIQACLSRHEEYASATRTVEVLLDYGGASVDAESRKLAEQNGLKDIVALLRKDRKREQVKGPPCWRLVVQSSFIAKGALHVPTKEMEAMAASGKRDYLKLKLDVQEYLKAPGGFADKRLSIQFYPEDRPTNPSVGAVKGLDGREVLAFLFKDDEPVLGDGKFYPAGYSPVSLQAFDESVSAQVKEEMERQKRILGTPEAHCDAKRDPLYPKVKAIIARIIVPVEQQDAFMELELLGPAAVPAIITLMDDRNPLPEKSISLLNKSPNAFEGIRHYGPEKVVDALDAILNQLTGEPLGGIENGGSEAARRDAVNAWRIYLHYLLEERDDAPHSVQ